MFRFACTARPARSRLGDPRGAPAGGVTSEPGARDCMRRVLRADPSQTLHKNPIYLGSSCAAPGRVHCAAPHHRHKPYSLLRPNTKGEEAGGRGSPRCPGRAALAGMARRKAHERGARCARGERDCRQQLGSQALKRAGSKSRCRGRSTLRTAKQALDPCNKDGRRAALTPRR